ncbi:MAG: hypothetical protein AABX88_00085 [Nanoarchaeota archaeon]
MERTQLIFYSCSMVISAFIGAMASNVWNEVVVKEKGVLKFLKLFGFFIFFMFTTLLIIYILAKGLEI